MQPGAVTYQSVAGAQPAMAGAVTYDGAAQGFAEGAVPGQTIVAPTYVAQQAQPSIPSFVAAPGSVTYGLPATQASVPQQGSITYAQPNIPSFVAAPGSVTYGLPA